ncbi:MULTISPECIES: hypothetical protein [unclassified Streptomyces]|uniref:hypothetical protein n=1 Tax=unclassified Streptomyces TaxID=2593676 RepID=UPI002E28B86E|nr:hypothetical protein [Streptomyces sp. NBC_00228]
MNGVTTTTGAGPGAVPQQDQVQRGSRLFIRTGFAVLAGVAAFFVTNVLNENDGDLWQWTMSIVLGCATLIVQLLVDFGERLEAVQESQKRRIRDMKDSLSSHHTEMRAAVDESFAKINAATELYSKVDGSVLRSDEVTRLVLGYTKVGEQGADIVKAFAEEELGRLALLMESLGNGTADCPGENHEWLIDLTKCVKRTLYATSTSVDRDFWSSEPARRYLAAQETAIKSRRVEIRRVFLVDEESEVTSSLRQLCERHRKFGIDARIAVRALLEPTAQMNSLNDFIVFDGELSYETEPDIRVMPAKTTLKMTHEHVEERINRFTVLWEATEPDHAPEPTPEPDEGRTVAHPAGPRRQP